MEAVDHRCRNSSGLKERGVFVKPKGYLKTVQLISPKSGLKNITAADS